MFRNLNKHFLLLHLIVFIWGFSPILGRYITADAWQLVWFRTLITVAAMYVYLRVTGQSIAITTKQSWQLFGIGLIIAVHWLTFYGAIRVSNISVTMIAFSTGTLFSSVLEPFFFKRRVRMYEVIIGIIIIGAIALIFSIHTHFGLGILLGISAAFTSSLFGVLNGIMSHRLAPGVISFYEIGSAFLGLTLFTLCTGKMSKAFLTLDQPSVIGITTLSVLCTVFPFITSVNLAKYISPYTIVLTVNLETVYGIVWAILFYNENRELSLSFYLGVLIILGAIFLNSYLRGWSERRKASVTEYAPPGL